MNELQNLISPSGKIYPKKVALLSPELKQQLLDTTGAETIPEALYIKLSDKEVHGCVSCGSKTAFKNYKSGYRKYCSTRCSGAAIRQKVNGKLTKERAEKYWETYPDKDKIVALYNSGRKIREISETLGQKYGSVRNVIVKSGCVIRSKSDYNHEAMFFARNPEAKILKLPETFDKYTSHELAKVVGVSLNTVHVYARKAGKPYTNNTGVSSVEQDVCDFLTELGVSNIIRNTKSLISPKEIDIYLPDHKLAIEVDGVYWHREQMGKGKSYHLDKTVALANKGIQLLHVFDVEWERNNGWKNKIRALLGMNTKLGARKTVVKYVDKTEAKVFFENYHIQGFIYGNKYIGLYDGDVLVSCIILGRNRFTSGIELLRFASSYGVSVQGGLSKMLNFSNEQSIVSYSDKRYSKDNPGVFTLMRETTPGFYYIVDGKLFHRMSYQKHKLREKLTTFDDTKTAYQNMLDNGHDRVWDCGQYVYRWDRPSC